jgi:sugar phosphate permease
MDRMIIATAIPYIAKDFNLSPVAMGAVMSAFFIGYTAMQIPGGLLVDKFGARKILIFAIGWWTVFTTCTGMVSSVVRMAWVRLLFGVGEGLGPGAYFRMIANWFPARERGTATAIIQSSTTLGPAFAPVIGALIISVWGWRTAFYMLAIPGILTILWIAYSLQEDPIYKKGIAAAELEEIKEPATASIVAESTYSFWQVLIVPAVWQSCILLAFQDLTLWGFRTWLPTYLVRARGFALLKMGFLVSLPFFVGTIGMLLGGWLSDNTFKNHRKVPLVINQWLSAACLYLTYDAASSGQCVLWMTLSGFFLSTAHGALWALPMTAISKAITGRGIAIVNTGGQLAGALSPLLVGFLVQLSGGGYGTTFMLMSCGVIVSSLFALLLKTNKKEPKLQTATAGRGDR